MAKKLAIDFIKDPPIRRALSDVDQRIRDIESNPSPFVYAESGEIRGLIFPTPSPVNKTVATLSIQSYGRPVEFCLLPFFKAGLTASGIPAASGSFYLSDSGDSDLSATFKVGLVRNRVDVVENVNIGFEVPNDIVGASIIHYIPSTIFRFVDYPPSGLHYYELVVTWISGTMVSRGYKLCASTLK